MIKYLIYSIIWLPVKYRAPDRGNVFPKGCRIVIAYRKNFLKLFIFLTTLPVASSKDFFLDKSWYNLTLDSLNNTTFNSVCMNVIDCIKPKIFLKASLLARHSVSSFFLSFSCFILKSDSRLPKKSFYLL